MFHYFIVELEYRPLIYIIYNKQDIILCWKINLFKRVLQTRFQPYKKVHSLFVYIYTCVCVCVCMYVVCMLCVCCVCDCMWLYMIVYDCIWLYMIVCDCMWLYMIVCDCMWLCVYDGIYVVCGERVSLLERF